MRTREDIDGLASWYADWAGLRVAVLGLGVTGFSVADTLGELGAELVVLASSADDKTARILEVLGIPLVLDDLEGELAKFAPELVIVSPGFSTQHPLVAWSVTAGVPVWGDVELAWRLRDKVPVEATGQPAEWLAVTGTNGKTTTVQLTTAMLKRGGVRAVACGNVGIPVLDAIRDPTGFDVLVVELSSFQLYYLESMSAWASACLNLSDDHLDWHGSAAAYREAKSQVYHNTRVACLYNLDDLTTRELVEEADVIDGCRAVGFGLGVPGPSDIGFVDEYLVDRAFHEERHHAAIELSTRHDLVASGLGSRHMAANVAAAAGLARSVGVEAADIRDALREFRLDHHRTEVVAVIDGIAWVNDSKATNPHAAQASLGSFDPVVWVVGGLLKGVDVDELVRANTARLRGAVVIGVDRQPLVEAFARHAPELPVFEVASTDTSEVMPTVVRLSAGMALAGDTVLLAPAAASMDQFIDYADRGSRFATAVRAMMGGRPDDDQSSSGTPAAS